MKRPSHKLLLLAFFFLLMTACASGPVKLIPTATDVDEIDFQYSRNISNYACGVTLFHFIPIATANRLQRAYEGLLERAAGDPIGGIKIQFSWRYIFIGTRYCTKMTAKAYSRQPRNRMDMNEI